MADCCCNSSNNGGDIGLADMAAGAFISGLLTFTFFVAEIASTSIGHNGEARANLEAFSHILSPPIAFIAFFSPDFTGTFLFFASLWHFFSESGQARPTSVLVLPSKRPGGTNLYNVLSWFQSLWLLVHHYFIGGFKVASTFGFVDLNNAALPESGVSPTHLIRTWMAGATLSHLSFGMEFFGIGGAIAVRLLSVVFRMGAAAAMVATQDLLIRASMSWDLFWMAVQLSLILVMARITVPTIRGAEAATAVPAAGAADAAGEAGKAGGGTGSTRASVAARREAYEMEVARRLSVAVVTKEPTVAEMRARVRSLHVYHEPDPTTQRRAIGFALRASDMDSDPAKPSPPAPPIPSVISATLGPGQGRSAETGENI